MSEERKLKWGLRFLVLIIVVSLVLWLLPLGLLFATGTPIPNEEGTGWVKFVSDNDVEWDAGTGCTITGVEIHAGWGTDTSEIIGNGNYGHIARYALNNQGNETGPPIIYNYPAGLYVPSTTTIPTNENPTEYSDWKYYGDYKVSGVGTQSARVYWDLATGSTESIVHQISWIKFYYTCTTPTPMGQIIVHKVSDGSVADGTSLSFSINTVPEQTINVSVGSTGSFTGLAANTYTVTETTTGYTTTVSPDNSTYTSGGSINATISGAVGSEDTVDVWFKNITESQPETGCITIYKELEGDLLVSGTFTFDIYDNSDGTGDPVATASINVTDNVPEGPAVVCGLTIGQTYYVEETGGPGTVLNEGLINGRFLGVSPCTATAFRVEQQYPCVVTFVNDPVGEEPGTGRVNVTKVVDNITDDPTLFNIEIYEYEFGDVLKGSGSIAETGSPAVFNLEPGKYRLDEIGLPTGYSLVGISGTKNSVALGDGIPATPSFEFIVGAEDVIDLVITNTGPTGSETPPPITTTTTTTTTTTKKTTTTTAATTGGTGTVEVLGITEELPFTGQSMILYIIGALMLALAGGLTFVLRAVKSKE